MRHPLSLVKPGQWVTSTAGRDKGCHYLVMKVFDDRWLHVVDGVRRTSVNPKRKSIRHVWIHDVSGDELGAKFDAGKVVPNKEIQSALTELVREEEEVGRPHG